MRGAGSTGGLRRAVAFLTPVGPSVPPSPAAVPWFPVVGAAIGAFLGLVWWIAGREIGPGVAAVLVIAGDLALTQMLHMDGLADAADGLIPPVDAGSGPTAAAARRLEIMSDPAIGAFGAIVVGTVLLARFAALASFHTSWDSAVLLVCGIWVASRALMAAALLGMPYARTEGGLATSFTVGTAPAEEPVSPEGSGVLIRHSGHMAVVAVFLAGAFGAAAWWRPVGGVVSLGSGLVAGVSVLAIAHRRIGGFTGDVLGAAGVVLETVALIVASARW